MERSSVLKNIQDTVYYIDYMIRDFSSGKDGCNSKHPDYTVGWFSWVPTQERVAVL
jgi:hypothetical protein